jgi:hypothetical protein
MAYLSTFTIACAAGEATVAFFRDTLQEPLS